MAGDNAAYKRKALETYKEIIKRGFWENIVNAALINDGIKIFVYILASPLIPFIHLYSIAHRVMNRNRHLRKLILSLPILFIFLLCWSVGENCGYISGIFKKHESP